MSRAACSSSRTSSSAPPTPTRHVDRSPASWAPEEAQHVTGESHARPRVPPGMLVVAYAPAAGMSDVDPTALFEPLYVAAAAGLETLRWDRGGPHPLLE